MRFFDQSSLSSGIVERISLLLTGLAVLLSTVGGSTPFTLGLALGGVIGAANFYLMRRLIMAIVTIEHPPRQIVLSLLFVIKFAVLVLVVYSVATYLSVDMMGVLLGVTTLVISIFIYGVIFVRRLQDSVEHSPAGQARAG